MPKTKPSFIPSVTGTLSTRPAPKSARAATKSTDPAKTLNLKNAKAATPGPPARSAASVVAPARRAARSAPARAAEPATQRAGSGAAGGPRAGGAGGPVVVLFRTDLRLDDHPALAHALQTASTVVALYCFDPRHFGRSPLGFDRTGRNRARFLLDAVADLRARLRAAGGELVVRFGEPERVAPIVARAAGARTVVLHGEPTLEEREVELALQSALAESGMEMCVVSGGGLYELDDLPFRAPADAPDSFPDFRAAVRAAAAVRAPVRAPDAVPALPAGVEAGEIPDLAALGVRDDDGGASRKGTIATRGGEREALGRMAMFVRKQARRAVGDGERSVRADFAHRVSPWLALGCVSARRVFHELKNGMGADEALACEAYNELLWRDFFRCTTAKLSAKRLGAAAQGASRPSSAAVQ